MKVLWACDRYRLELAKEVEDRKAKAAREDIEGLFKPQSTSGKATKGDKHRRDVNLDTFIPPLKIVPNDAQWPISEKNWENQMALISEDAKKSAVIELLEADAHNELLCKRLRARWDAQSAMIAYCIGKFGTTVHGTGKCETLTVAQGNLKTRDKMSEPCCRVDHPGACATRDADVLNDVCAFADMITAFVRSLSDDDRQYIMMTFRKGNVYTFTLLIASTLLSGESMQVFLNFSAEGFEGLATADSKYDGITMYDLGAEGLRPMSLIPKERLGPRLKKPIPCWFSCAGFARALAVQTKTELKHWEPLIINVIELAKGEYNTVWADEEGNVMTFPVAVSMKDPAGVAAAKAKAAAAAAAPPKPSLKDKIKGLKDDEELCDDLLDELMELRLGVGKDCDLAAAAARAAELVAIANGKAMRAEQRLEWRQKGDLDKIKHDDEGLESSDSQCSVSDEDLDLVDLMHVKAAQRIAEERVRAARSAKQKMAQRNVEKARKLGVVPPAPASAGGAGGGAGAGGAGAGAGGDGAPSPSPGGAGGAHASPPPAPYIKDGWTHIPNTTHGGEFVIQSGHCNGVCGNPAHHSGGQQCRIRRTVVGERGRVAGLISLWHSKAFSTSRDEHNSTAFKRKLSTKAHQADRLAERMTVLNDASYVPVLSTERPQGSDPSLEPNVVPS